jgi:hypothetical protein
MNNFMDFLQSWLSYQTPTSAATSVMVTPTSGPAQSVTVYSVATANFGSYYDTTPAPRADLGGGATGRLYDTGGDRLGLP